MASNRDEKIQIVVQSSPSADIHLDLEMIQKDKIKRLNAELFQAIADKDEKQVEKSIREGADLFSQNDNAQTPLEFAAEKGNIESIKTIINAWPIPAPEDTGFFAAIGQWFSAPKKVLPNPQSHYNQALIIAVKKQNEQAVEALLKAGANPNTICSQNEDTVLHEASKSKAKMVRDLLIYGAKPDVKNRLGQTPIQGAKLSLEWEQIIREFTTRYAETGSLGYQEAFNDALKLKKDVIAFLLLRDNELNVMGYDSDNKSGLHYAIESENIELLSVMLNLDEITIRNLIEDKEALAKFLSQYEFPFPGELHGELIEFAILQKKWEMVDILMMLQKHNPNEDCGFSKALMAAVRTNNEKLTRILEPDSKNLDIQDKNGDTLLHIASANGNVKFVNWLIRKVDNTILNNRGKTAIELADKSKDNWFDLISAFTAKRDREGKARYAVALVEAAKRNNSLLLMRLLVMGAQDNIPDPETGNYPLHFAVFHGNKDAIEELLNQDSICRVNREGATPIQLLKLDENWKNLVSLFLKQNDSTQKGRYGFALLRAAEINDLGLVIDLLNAGARPNIKDRTTGNLPLHYAAQNANKTMCTLLLNRKYLCHNFNFYPNHNDEIPEDILERRLKEKKDEADFLAVVAFKKIYKALRNGQSGFDCFKTNFLADKENLDVVTMLIRIESHTQRFPHSRTAEAWRLAKLHAKDPTENNLKLVTDIHKWAFKNSGYLFKRTCVVKGVTFFSGQSFEAELNKRATKSLTEDEINKQKQRSDSNRTKTICLSLR